MGFFPLSLTFSCMAYGIVHFQCHVELLQSKLSILSAATEMLLLFINKRNSCSTIQTGSFEQVTVPIVFLGCFAPLWFSKTSLLFLTGSWEEGWGQLLLMATEHPCHQPMAILTVRHCCKCMTLNSLSWNFQQHR